MNLYTDRYLKGLQVGTVINNIKNQCGLYFRYSSTIFFITQDCSFKKNKKACAKFYETHLTV